MDQKSSGTSDDWPPSFARPEAAVPQGPQEGDMLYGPGPRQRYTDGQWREFYSTPDRGWIRDNPAGVEFRKTARIVALQPHAPFVVTTDRGLMQGEAGDWLATNHPDDDPGSDVWPISADRMATTYEPLPAGDDALPQAELDFERKLIRQPPERLLRAAIEVLRGAERQDRHTSLAITNAEQTLLWTQARDVL